jgi:hypothetical protein
MMRLADLASLSTLPASRTLHAVAKDFSRYKPMVGDILTTYGRLGGQFDDLYLDSSELFEFAFSEDPVVPVNAYLATCDGDGADVSP